MNNLNAKSILIITPFLNKITPANFRITSFISEFKKQYLLYVVNTSFEKLENSVHYYQIDEDASAKFFHLRTNPVFRSFLLPFFYIGWIIKCFIKSSSIIEKKSVDMIFVSHGPPHVLFVGYLLKLRYCRCKFITDYRDSWTDNPYRKYPSIILKKMLENIEYKILTESNLIIAVSIIEKRKFKKYQLDEKIKIIRNGFLTQNNIIDKNRDYYKISHSGTFIKIRQPDQILSAYKIFLRSKPKTKLFLVGDLDSGNLLKIKKLGLENDVVITGTLEYSESLKNIYDSDLLLFYEPTNAMTTKIYDYISSGNPMVVITQNYEIEGFIKKYSPFSVIINGYDTEKFSDALQSFYQGWEEDVKYGFDLKPEYFSKYNRERLAKKLLSYINKLEG